MCSSDLGCDFYLHAILLVNLVTAALHFSAERAEALVAGAHGAGCQGVACRGDEGNCNDDLFHLHSFG